MYLKSCCSTVLSIDNQAGFLMPLALFIIIIVAGATLLLSQQLTQATISSSLTINQTQSLYAAETGAQLGSNQLLFPGVGRQQTDARCSSLSINQAFAAPGLHQCTIQVSCVCRYENGAICNSTQINHYNGSAGITFSYYDISSEARCGSDVYEARQQYQLKVRYP